MASMLTSLKASLQKKFVFRFSRLDRPGVSASYIKGEGIEIGGLNYPLVVRDGVKVKYVDRIPAEEQFDILSELKGQKLVPVDIVDDGETLATIADGSQDFVIANHFIEHTQNVVLTIQNMLRVLRRDGVIFMAIPDKRQTFDHLRAITTTDHLIRDYELGPAQSEHGHYFDFVKYTDHGLGKSDSEIEKVIEELKAKNWSIHFHVWDHQAMIDMFCMMKKHFGFAFEIEVARAAQSGGHESIFVLRKF
jgi:SAM-dependent methyltransferase